MRYADYTQNTALSLSLIFSENNLVWTSTESVDEHTNKIFLVEI
jgi:hypothetical protein